MNSSIVLPSSGVFGQGQPQPVAVPSTPGSTSSLTYTNSGVVLDDGMNSMEEEGHSPPQSVAGIVPILQNIVATVNLDCKLDLKTIALHARNAEYNPKVLPHCYALIAWTTVRFAAVIMRIREPKTTALIFASGKMVVTGAKSEDDSKLASRKYARIIQKLGFQAKFTDFKIQNIVGSCDVKFPIRLEGLAYSHGHFSSYEPELFPGLIYRMVKPKIVLLIFVSGKIVLTGAKVREEIYQAFEAIYPVLTEFRKP
ncbi:hypothetical protein G9A89_011321 [Geosiphon pyriformis]|nr:hypothetical protein G9A89_011321 [Geosiphon pyriformis]